MSFTTPIKVADKNGKLLPAQPPIFALRFADGLTPTFVPTGVLAEPGGAGQVTGYYLITPTGVGVNGQNITPASITTTGNVSVGGLLIQGGGQMAHGTATTVGGATQALAPFAMLLADNSVLTAHITMSAITVSGSRFAFVDDAFGVVVLSGTPTVSPSNATMAHNYGFPPSYAASWAAGIVSVDVTGPLAHVVGTADNGGGWVRVEVAETTSEDGLSGVSVTGAGIGGTTEANGAHVATWIDPTHFDLLAVAFVNPWTSGGTFTLTTSPTITWSGLAVAVRAPAP